MAIFFWLFLALTLFDIDLYLISKFVPALESVLYYKFFIFIGAVSIAWLIIGKKEFPKLVLYVILYPLIVILWKTPLIAWRNWSVAIILSPVIFTIASNFRSFFMGYALAMIITILIISFHNVVLLTLSMIILLMLLFVHLALSLLHAYKSTVFTKIADSISNIKIKLEDSTFLESMLETSQTKSSEGQKNEGSFDDRLSTLYIFHWFVELINDKTRLVMRSRKMDLYLILSWFWTVALTTFVFSLEYFALYKIRATAFLAPYTLNYFSFLGFSFETLTTSNISAIEPSTFYAKTLCSLELACSLVIIIILVFTILTAARERYKEDIEQIARSLNDIALIIQDSSQRLFDLALTDVEIILVEHNQSLVNGLRKIRGLPEIRPKIEDTEEGSP